MNRRRRLVRMRLRAVSIALAFALGAWVPVSRILAADQPSGISKDAKEAPDAGGYRAQIQSVVKARVEKLKDPSPTAQKEARDQLIADTQIPGSAQPPSASFLTIYAGAVNDALLPLAKDQTPKSMRSRLNAAIVIAQIASHCDNDQLKPAVIAFLKDKYDPVAMWAMKAAKYVLFYNLRNPAVNNAQPLLGAMVDSVKAHRAAGVAQEAYEAVGLGLIPGSALQNNVKDVTEKMITAVIPTMQDLLQARIDAYVDSYPEEPTSEKKYATLFLSLSKVWSAYPPPVKDSQGRTIQLMYDLASVSAQRAVGASEQNRKQFIETISGTARAIQVLGGALQDQPIVDAAKLLSQAIPATPDAEINTRIAGVLNAFKANPAYKGVNFKPPPTVKAVAAPATSSTRPGGSMTPPSPATENAGETAKN